MKPSTLAIAALIAAAPAAYASTAAEREYQRGYNDCSHGRYDQNQHGESYKMLASVVHAGDQFVSGGGKSVSLAPGCTPDPKLGACVVNFGLTAHKGPDGVSGHITLNLPDLDDQVVADVTCLENVAAVPGGYAADITGTITKQKNGIATGGFFSRVVIHVTDSPAGDTMYAIFDNGEGCAAHDNQVPVLRGNIVINP